MQITTTESVAISYLRVMALVSIISCHIFQALDNRWAWVLNMGVQVFFFISGFLYGHKDIQDWIRWYKNRFKKIYFPFIITAIVFIICYMIFTTTEVKIHSIFAYITGTQWFGGKVKGLGHLWFVTAILLCYLCSPILQILRSFAFKVCILLVACSLYELLIVRYDVTLFMPVFIYSFGYLYSNLNEKKKRWFASAMVVFAVAISYRITWNHIMIYDGVMNQLLHVFGGISLSILVITILSKVIKVKSRPKIIEVLDDYSYEMYLVHHPLILGSLSMMFITKYSILNIFMVLIITAVLSFLLKQLCRFLYSNLN